MRQEFSKVLQKHADVLALDSANIEEVEHESSSSSSDSLITDSTIRSMESTVSDLLNEQE
jgi:hypothetical protein